MTWQTYTILFTLAALVSVATLRLYFRVPPRPEPMKGGRRAYDGEQEA